MKQRVITAVIALAFFIPLMIMGGIPFQLVVVAMGVIGIYELFNMKGLELKCIEGALTLLATAVMILGPGQIFGIFPTTMDTNSFFYLFVMIILMLPVFSKNEYTIEDAAFPVMISLYVGMGFKNLLVARDAGMPVIIYALFVVWATDIGAYFFGRKFGTKKFAPHISPNKTIEGALGGILSAVVVSLFYLMFFPMPNYSLTTMLVLTIIFSVISQLGDLVQSAYKRYYNVKDSGKILPGHGGILDRFDSLLFVFPLMHMLGVF
ncbi:phosphatidate cytidylyltransferase [Vagococcus silagei]|uniref:Phosphatidate cytidylyltransferase n=1 Tax=Vagococcus silagei TaxID=2508885 RepID=A0A4S3B6B6_9ENTE|nr:phosphatidate cytidylyltransferase [Vagococcus silagei]THB61917.1 phosphatidate cytidylyltransferase [Vagococcus silagei]